MRRHAPTATRTPSGYAPEEDDAADALGAALGAATAGAFAAGLLPSRRPSMLVIRRWGREEEGSKVVRVVKSDLAGLKSVLAGLKSDLTKLAGLRSDLKNVRSDLTISHLRAPRQPAAPQ
jgi:hypothetical protein